LISVMSVCSFSWNIYVNVMFTWFRNVYCCWTIIAVGEEGGILFSHNPI
jgi:hypothetical protein